MLYCDARMHSIKISIVKGATTFIVICRPLMIKQYVSNQVDPHHKLLP